MVIIAKWALLKWAEVYIFNQAFHEINMVAAIVHFLKLIAIKSDYQKKMNLQWKRSCWCLLGEHIAKVSILAYWLIFFIRTFVLSNIWLTYAHTAVLGYSGLQPAVCFAKKNATKMHWCELTS